jgi:hypothetical protein
MTGSTQSMRRTRRCARRTVTALLVSAAVLGMASTATASPAPSRSHAVIVEIHLPIVAGREGSDARHPPTICVPFPAHAIRHLQTGSYMHVGLRIHVPSSLASRSSERFFPCSATQVQIVSGETRKRANTSRLALAIPSSLLAQVG